MLPLRDENPHFLVPFATLALILANAAAWVFVQGLGMDDPLAKSICEFGLIPARLFGAIQPGTQVPLGPGHYCLIGPEASWLSVLTSMFLHGGWLHILGNMWFLWIFGNNVEDSLGHIRFLLFYVLAGVAAALAQIWAAPGSQIPMVGASGAIGGVMGAYLRLYPRVRVHVLVILGVFVTTISVPAILMLGYWFLLQLASGLMVPLGADEGGVAFWAHIGGFVFGLLTVGFFADPDLVERHPSRWRSRRAY